MKTHAKAHYYKGYGPGPGRGRRSRHMAARRWMAENPTPDQIITMLEEYQRDLEQQVADVASRIEELKRQTPETTDSDS